MGAKPRKLSQANVLRRIRYWKERLLLNDWKLSISFEPDEEEESEASCRASPEYLQAVLRFDLTKIDPDEIDSYVVHELLHMYVWPLANFAHSACGKDKVKLEALRNYEEQLTTRIERLVEHLVRDE